MERLCMGGANGGGTLFSIHTDGSGFIDLLDFNSANGYTTFGTPVISGNVLYGASGGGAYTKGLIYSIHTDGTAYHKLLDFDGANGLSPMGSLILSGNRLLGTTGSGGIYDYGTIFSIDTSGSNFQTLYNFNIPTGYQPRAPLSQSGDMLFGTAVLGGNYNKGVIFGFNTNFNAIPGDPLNDDELSVYPNPAYGEFTLKTSISGEFNIEMYNIFGEKVYSKITDRKLSEINLSVSGGIYFIQLIQGNNLLAQDRLIITH